MAMAYVSRFKELRIALEMKMETINIAKGAAFRLWVLQCIQKISPAYSSFGRCLVVTEPFYSQNALGYAPKSLTHKKVAPIGIVPVRNFT